MQQEDDLRALAKVMDVFRAVSLLFLLAHCYFFCYGFFTKWGLTLPLVDRIFLDFQRESGLFSSVYPTLMFCLLFLFLYCMGNRDAAVFIASRMP